MNPSGMSPALPSFCGVATKSGRFLVAKRKPGGTQGGKWEFPGGKGEPGETPQAALKREFLEELHVDIEVGDLIMAAGFENAGKRYRLEAYRITLHSQNLILEEHEEYRWCTLEELKVLELCDSDALVLKGLETAQR